MSKYVYVEAKNDQGTTYFYIGEKVGGTVFAGQGYIDSPFIMAPSHWRTEHTIAWKTFDMGIMIFSPQDIISLIDVKKSDISNLPPGYSY